MKNFEVIKVKLDELLRHPKHQETFLNPEDKNLDQLRDSITNGQDSTISFVEEPAEGGLLIKQVFDGWSRVTILREQGEEYIWAQKHNFNSENELLLKMTEMQTNYHNSYQEKFNMIKAVWHIFSKGKGFRSDLADEVTEEGHDTSSSDSKKVPEVYERIAKHLKMKSGTEVKHIKKVGLVNPMYFERMDSTRWSLFASYQECLKEEKNGKEDDHRPELPAIKEPVYISSVTTDPSLCEHGNPISTDPEQDTDQQDDSTESNDENADSVAAVTQQATPPVGRTITVTCENCNHEFEWKINLNQ
jgi:hypothetical protein